jgi:hypothetical protein
VDAPSKVLKFRGVYSPLSEIIKWIISRLNPDPGSLCCLVFFLQRLRFIVNPDPGNTICPSHFHRWTLMIPSYTVNYATFRQNIYRTISALLNQQSSFKYLEPSTVAFLSACVILAGCTLHFTFLIIFFFSQFYFFQLF